jgi:hypothetical protein
VSEQTILAADTATTTLAGAAVTLLVAGMGWLGTRKSRPEATSILVDSAVKLAQAANAESDDLRATVAALRLEVEGLRAAVTECERKHSQAQAAMASAGIVVDD